jgi:hypothetical protein
VRASRVQAATSGHVPGRWLAPLGLRLGIDRGEGRRLVALSAFIAIPWGPLPAPARAERSMSAIAGERVRPTSQPSPRRVCGHRFWRLSAPLRTDHGRGSAAGKGRAPAGLPGPVPSMAMPRDASTTSAGRAPRRPCYAPCAERAPRERRRASPGPPSPLRAWSSRELRRPPSTRRLARSKARRLDAWVKRPRKTAVGPKCPRRNRYNPPRIGPGATAEADSGLELGSISLARGRFWGRSGDTLGTCHGPWHAISCHSGVPIWHYPGPMT